MYKLDSKELLSEDGLSVSHQHRPDDDELFQITSWLIRSFTGRNCNVLGTRLANGRV